MKSLFPRIFLSFWIAMTLIGAAFAAIYATTFPSARMERRRHFMQEALVLEAERAVASPDPEAELERFERQTDIELFVSDARGRIAGAPREIAAIAAETVREGTARTDQVGDAELTSLVLADGRVAVARITRPSRWMIWLGGETLPQRLLVVFAISGLVSLLLARYLTRSLRSLRRATQRIAEGDLAVRVGPELGKADAEIAALGHDFDRMAQRVEELLDARQRLLSDVSHELNSPIARLRVALELARKSAGEGAQGPLDRIEREAERLGQLVGEILMVTRLEQDEARKERVDAGELVEEIVRDADFEARASGRTVTLERVAGAILDADEEILRRAVENIVRNAMRFTPEGTGVEVRLDRDGETLTLTVRDRGPGVPEHALRDIFVPLYRVDPDRDRKTGGAGLGLAIAERAVKLHRGSIEAQNAEGGGLRVTVRLPMS